MKHELTFGIIGAMDSEIRRLLEAANDWQTQDRAGLTFYAGTRAGQRLVLVKSGIGKVNAARCAQILLDCYAPDYLINTGIAGGLSQGLGVGDVVVGAELVQHDFDVTAFGHARGYLCTGEDDTKPTVFRSDEQLVSLVADLAVDAPYTIRRGRIATGDAFISSRAAKAELSSLFAADAAEMEGAAIAQTAAACGVPFLVLRAISDLADGTAADSFDAFEQETADRSASLLLTLIDTLGSAACR